MKQSVDLMNSMKRFSFRHSNTVTGLARRISTAVLPALARRALLLFSILSMGVGNVWGETKEIHKYIKWDQTSAVFNVSDAYTQLGISLSVLKAAHRIDWYVLNEISVKQSLSYGDSQKTGVWTFYSYHSWEFWPYAGENGNTNVYLDSNTNYWDQGDLESRWTSWNLSKPTIFAPSGGTFETYKDYVVVCEVSAETSPSEVGVRYVFHFNETGIEPDDFTGTFSGTETLLSHEVASRASSTTTTIDMSGVLTTLPSAKYARFYLEKNGEAQDISSTAITFAGSQTTDKASRGAYLYTGSTLTTSDLSVITVNLPSGTYEDYQLIAVSSDDEPRAASGTTVTQEPADLDVKYVYSFTYPIDSKDKYITWNSNETTLPIASYIAEDLPALTSSSTTGYIAWYVLDGSANKVELIADHYNNHTQWSFSSGGAAFSPYNTGNTGTTFSISDSQISSNWSTFTSPQLNAPGTDLFEKYSNYTVVCDVSDVSSSKIKVRYVFHFNDGYSAESAELTTGMTVKREHNSKLTAELNMASSEHFDDVNGQFGNHLNDASNVEKLYIRWYLADKEGNRVDVPAGITFSPVYAGYADKVIDGTNFGKVLHLGNAGAVVTEDMLKMNVEVTDGDIDLDDYQVVCALGYADDGYTKEPSPLKAKYIYNFESPFEGKVSPSVTTHTKEIIVHSDETVKEIPLDNYFNEILSDLSTTAEDLGKSLHIRWYIQHGDERYLRSDLQLEAVDTEIGYKKHAGVSESPNRENGSLYWNTTTCGIANPLLSGKLNVKFTIPTNDKLWENYKVIAVLTKDLSGQEVSGDELTKEPQVLDVQYIFSMIDSEFKFVHHKGASGRDYFTHDDDVNITAQSGDYTMSQTTIFLPSAINATGGRGDGFFVSDRYTLGSAKQSNIDPETGAALSKGDNDLYPKFGGLTVKKDNPLKTAKFKISGINSVVAYLVSTNKSKQRTCYATATPSDGSDVVASNGTSDHEGHTAVITLNLDPTKEYLVDFSDSREYGTENGGDMSLMGVRFVKDGTEPVVYAPEQLVQYSWDNANSRVNIAERPDIRQGVHTVHYYMYIKPTDGEKMLRLPFQYYDGSGNNLEPMAYIRWYDWTADLSSKRLVMKGTLLKELTDVAGNRGFFMLNNSVPNLQPCHNNVGVTYNPSSLTKDGDIIACDVSKYYDGLYPGTEDDDRTGFGGQKYPQLVHEPTLSTRYLFHVFPSSVIVKDIKEGADRFTTALSGLTSENFAERKKTMFNLYENNGRVIVSLKGSASEFAVRAQLQTLDEYYVYNNTDEGVQCSKIRWTSYLEDENGLWSKEGDLVDNAGRIHSFTLSDFSGSYSHLTGSLGSKDVTAAPGMRFHIIGYIGGGGYEAPAIHYELQFLDAPAILAEKLKATDVKRTIDYLNLHYREGGAVTFDNYFADLSAPTTEAENMLYTPLAWKEAQYGFCYPSIDKYRIRTGYSGLTPIHGDYMLLKSMNRSGVSASATTTDGDTPAAGCKYGYKWYNAPVEPLYDCTHLRDNSKYGGYIYVDASDESRNIATLDFSASLCAGSQIYFTAAIADVTEGGKTSPQLMANVYAKNEFGDRTHVMSFLTCVLNTVNTGDEGSYQHNKWYQVYGHGNIPENIDITNFTDFTVEIDNYSKNTEGADFCVDQIVFYTSTGKIQVEQTGGMCEDQDLSVTALMEVENLENMVTLSNTPKTLYYKFFRITSKNDNGIITFEPIDDTSIYNNGENKYGQLDVSKYVLKADGTLDDSSAEIIARNGNYVIKDGILYLKLLDNKVINLPQGYNYFIAMPKNLQSPDLSKWADPNNACEVYSKFFLPKKTFVNFLDSDYDVVSQTVNSACGLAKAQVNYFIQANFPDENEPSGFKSLPLGTAGDKTDKGVLFDFFLGTKEQLNEQHATYGNKKLIDALQAYRAYERTNATEYSTTLLAAYESENSDYYKILNDAITNNLLLLRASNKLDYELTTETTSFWAIPVNTNYTFDEKNYTICDYIPFTFTLKSGSGGPELVLGFDDVDYETAGTKRVLRVGLEQLNKMRTQRYILHVPVNRFSDKYGKTDGKVYFPSDSYLTISAVDKSASPTVPNTTDPTLPAVGTKFAKIVPINSIETRPWVDKDHMYLALDLSGTNCAITFHEGYQYEVGTIFYDAEDEGAATPCIGDLFMVIKVVPEFVTWEAQNVDNDGNPTTTTTDYWSANWYNDGNWQRSTRAELYKGSGTQNTATAGHPSGYENNGEGNLSGLTTGNPGFVPMRFTYVTLPTGNHAPSLINEPRVVGTGKGARRQGGGFLDLTRTTLLTDRSPNANTDGMSLAERQNSKPTENIYYDMLVRYGEYHTGDNPDEHYGEGCFGHRYIKSDGTWDDQGTQDLTAMVFDVEKFQGNVCREIYFKPGAELLRPHRLQYEKAWVEKELDANKWYLISSPLKNTYAGDMYVPFTNGRQETEAFQPITFNTTTYSRTRYPIYQRSWGMNNGTVYVQQNDIRANSYSANLKYNEVTTNMAEWGHTFNDVQVPYNTMTAFAIRAHKKNQTDKTLIRLPKADTSYDYYDWSGDSPDPAAGTGIKTVDKVSVYKLVTDYQDDTNTETSPLEFNISTMQQQGDYVLVGNPFMVSIDMKKFFDGNTELSTDGYWTYEASVAEAHAVPTVAKTTVIKPLQAFFVKKGTATKITFTKEMQIDGNFPTPPGWTDSSNPAPALVLTAENEQGSSKANVLVGEGQNVETLFDSNLEDVPMVYTVADGQAVSINHTKDWETTGFGVVCNSPEAVEVTLTGVDNMEGELYVVDAVDGKATEVAEGQTVTVVPNEYGRYFLTRSASLGEVKEGLSEGIMVSVHGGVVSITAAKALGAVRAMSINGATVYQSSDCDNSVQFQSQQGIYVIEVAGEAGNRTMKIVVK